MNQTSIEYLYSTAENLKPFDLAIQSSQFLEVDVDRDITQLKPGSEVYHNIDTQNGAEYDFKSSYLRGSLALNNLTTGLSGSGFTTTGITTQSVSCFQMSLMAGLYRYSFEVNKVPVENLVATDELTPLAQGLYYMLNHCERTSGGKATLGVVSSDGISTTSNIFVSTDGAMDFAEMIFNTAPATNQVIVDLIDPNAVALDSGFAYRVSMIRPRNIYNDNSRTSSIITDWLYTPVVNFVGRVPVDLISNNPYGMPANIPYRLRCKMLNSWNVFRGEGIQNIVPSIAPTFRIQMISQKFMVKVNKLQPDALRLMQSVPLKTYDMFGYSFQTYPLVNKDFQFKLPEATTCPSAMLFVILRNKMFQNAPPYSEGQPILVDTSTYPKSDTLANGLWECLGGNVDAGSAYGVQWNSFYVLLNGLRFPSSDKMISNNVQNTFETTFDNLGAISAQPAATVYSKSVGSSDFYEMTKRCFKNGEDFYTKDLHALTGIVGIDFVQSQNPSSRWWNTRQLVSNTAPTVVGNFSIVGANDIDQSQIMLTGGAYSLGVLSITNRIMTIVDNEKVSFSAP